MASFPTDSIPFSGIIGVTDPTDTYAVTVDYLNQGGHRVAADDAARDAITVERRAFGMLVSTQDALPPVTYQLANAAMGGADNVLSNNANWIVFSAGGSGGISIGTSVSGGSPNRVLYIDAAGALAVDNPFQYVAATGYMSIGQVLTPDAKLDIGGVDSDNYMKLLRSYSVDSDEFYIQVGDSNTSNVYGNTRFLINPADGFAMQGVDNTGNLTTQFSVSSYNGSLYSQVFDGSDGSYGQILITAGNTVIDQHSGSLGTTGSFQLRTDPISGAINEAYFGNQQVKIDLLSGGGSQPLGIDNDGVVGIYTGGGGSQDLDSVLNIGNTSLLGIDVGLSTFTTTTGASSINIVYDSSMANNLITIHDNNLGFDSTIFQYAPSGPTAIAFPDTSGTLAISVNGVPADIHGNVDITSTLINIYNSDGTLTGPRIVDGSNNDLSWNSMGAFTIATVDHFTVDGGTTSINVNNGADVNLAAGNGDALFQLNNDGSAQLSLTKELVTGGTSGTPGDVFTSNGPGAAPFWGSLPTPATPVIEVIHTDSLASTIVGAGSGTGTSSEAIYLGVNAGVGATNSTRSNIIGYGAGLNASNAQFANFIGVDAGSGATNAGGSNFIGESAGFGASSANGSNFIGTDTGAGATSAQSSNFFGSSAGSNAANAANSIFIGTGAGSNDTVNNTGSANNSSILIGNYINTGGFSNSIVLGSGGIGAPVPNTASNEFLIPSTYTRYNFVGIPYLMPTAQATTGQVLTAVSIASGLATLGWTTVSSGGGTVTSVSGTTNRITSTGGVTPVIDIAATYVGQTSITTLGTVATGTWNATSIGNTKGGTGQDSSAATGVAQVNSGTWSFSTALANGTTATTQTAADNSTKVATTAYVDSAGGAFLPIIGRTYTTTTGNGLALTTSTLTSGNLVSLASTGTAAASNTQTVLNIATSGTAASQTTWGLDVANTHTGASSVNIGARFTASGGTSNYAALFSGQVGMGTATPTGALDVADTVLAGSGSLAGSLLNLTQTWNTSGAPTGIKFNATLSAASTSALLIDLQVNGATKFNINRLGLMSVVSIGATGNVNAVNVTATGTFTGGNIIGADTTLAGSGSLAGSVLALTQTWNTSGSPKALLVNVTNTASGTGSRLAELQVGGAAVWGALPTAQMQLGSDINIQIGAANSANGNASASGDSLRFLSRTTNSIGSYSFWWSSNSAYNPTSGTGGFHNIGSSFTPSSGTAVWNTVLIAPTVNQTGGASGVTRGIYVAPTLTAAADFRAIEVTTGISKFTGVSAATTTKTGAYTATFNDFTIRVDATSGAVTITLPPVATARTVGAILNIKKVDSGVNIVTIQANGAETIDGANTKAIATQYTNVQLQNNGTTWDIL